MNNFLIIIFWLGCFISLYSYLLYPLLLLLLARRGGPEPDGSQPLPALSVIVTVHNGERSIAEKLEDTLRLDYPEELRQILVASDASTDATDDIAAGFAVRGVKLVRSPLRKGKEHAQYLAISAATGSVLVFTDVGTRLDQAALRTLAGNFADPGIGAVSSEDELKSQDGEVRGEGAYVRYEMWLRRLESAAAGLVGLSGSCFAVRRGVCTGWRTDTPSDITVALLCAQARLKAVTDYRVKGSYQDLKEETEEFVRKKRTIIRGMTAVWELRQVLNWRRSGWFALQVWSHKIMRWLVPAGLILALSGAAVLAAGSPFYQAMLVIQLLGYLAAAVGYFSSAARSLLPVRIALFFVVANAATAAAAWDFLRGVRIVVWTPSSR